MVRVRDDKSEPHIGIVGAGLSGLRCADILLQHGFKVTIIEARNRVGGRVNQNRLTNGHWVDEGPNWIHGTDNNPILDIAKQTQTAAGDYETETYIFDEDGNLLPTKEAGKYTGLMWNIIGDAFKHSNSLGQNIAKDESLLDFFEKKVKEAIPETETDHVRSRTLILQMAKLWGAFIGSPVQKQSLRFFWLEECIDGGKPSYHAILNNLPRKS